jgi:hypothetical protein
VKTVAHVGMSSWIRLSHATVAPCWMSSQCWPGCVSSYGIAP